MRILCVTAVVLALAVPGGAVFAQTGAFGWGPNNARLTDRDYALLGKAISALNHSPRATVGDTRSWTNPASGNAGTVAIQGMSRRDGMPCHALDYAISFRGQPVPQNYRFTWCKVAGGSWKQVS
ncbi:hypothetical protein [Rhodopila sp.]|jgi:hypothetical protein|uniref:hypothetical protein n=1 Tax=Rhodopila sp. TaxID=2480087 RepID=UPI002C341A44|nr:hypothetical protein [Rhodopila sp.]HVZ07211.1 hypothetical protein [Rhodopila sp.]